MTGILLAHYPSTLPQTLPDNLVELALIQISALTGKLNSLASLQDDV